MACSPPKSKVTAMLVKIYTFHMIHLFGMMDVHSFKWFTREKVVQ